MHGRYIARSLEKGILRSTELFPTVAVLGIRQSGKSTMLGHILPPNFHSVSVDNIFEINLAETDPVGYIFNHGLPLLLSGF